MKNIKNNLKLNKSQLLDKAKEIIFEIILIINKYSDYTTSPKNKKLEFLSDDRIRNINESLKLHEFIAIENKINEILPPHFEKDRILLKVKFDELKSQLLDLAEDFENATSDTINFSGYIDESVSHIEKSVELKEVEEIRQTITSEIGTLRKKITLKQEKDIEMINLLCFKLKALGEQLILAKEEALMDGLTQLYNRNAFNKKLADAFGKNTVRRKSLTLIMADIDYFKKINDTYGHIVGDDAIQKVANVMKGIFRLNDFAARYGGEEFAILIERIDKKAVHDICERFRSEVNNIALKVDNEIVPISISIGVSFCRKTDTPKTLINRADRSLYMAKGSGRNIVKTEDECSFALQKDSNTTTNQELNVLKNKASLSLSS